jgi:outer membrane protein
MGGSGTSLGANEINGRTPPERQTGRPAAQFGRIGREEATMESSRAAGPMALRVRRGAGAALIGVLVMAGAARAETLSDALVLAYNNSPLLEQQRQLLRVNDERVAQAVARLRPTLDFVASYGKRIVDERPRGAPRIVGGETIVSRGARTTTTKSLALVMDWLLLDGGARSLRVGAAKEAVLAARYGLTQVEQQVLLSAVQAYTDLLAARRRVEVQEGNLRLVTQELQATRDRFEVGEVTRTDVALSESRLAAGQSALAAARGQVEIAIEVYERVVGRPPVGPLSPLPPAPEIPSDDERATALALRVSPVIAAQQHAVTANELLVAAADADRLPSVSFDARGSSNLSGDEDLTLGLSASQRLYSGGLRPSLGRQAQAELNASRSELAQTARETAEDVGRAYAVLAIAQAQITSAQQQVRSARLAFEGTREEALLGARTTLDVLDAEQDLLDAQLSLVEARADAAFAVYQVLAAVGLMTTSHLGLSVERYDPSDYYAAVADAPTSWGTEYGTKLDRVLRRYGRD